jgi:hypothetical protein
MLKIFPLNDFHYSVSLLENHHFIRTLVGHGSTDILDLEKRSSWTHTFSFDIHLFPDNVLQFMEQNHILTFQDDRKYGFFQLLKYEKGDFFLNHRDTNMTVDDCIHEYTCLIFCPYGDDYDTLQGGELVFTHPDGLYHITFDPSVETRSGRFVMILFSIDMYHEVLPIINGSRYVFKKPLFVKKSNHLKMVDLDVVDELCDGGFHPFPENGDY